MASALEQLLVIAPKFTAVDSERLTAVIAIAAGQVGAVFGSARNLATAYLAAHMLEIAGDAGGSVSGTGGLVTMEKEGELMRSYGPADGAGGSGDAVYKRTVWGQEYLRIRAQRVMGPRTRSGVIVDDGS